MRELSFFTATRQATANPNKWHAQLPTGKACPGGHGRTTLQSTTEQKQPCARGSRLLLAYEPEANILKMHF
jgi:hypothetical protein